MTTALDSNAFHVLGATPHDPVARLFGLADDKALIGDAEVSRKAYAQLTNPRARLAAELGWLPGLTPEQASLGLGWIDRLGEPGASARLPALARANLIAADIERRPGPMDAAGVVDAILRLASASEPIDLARLLDDLNADRVIAGMPVVQDVDSVASELETQRRHHMRVVRDLMDQLPTAALIKAFYELIVQSTLGLRQPAPRLVRDLGDAYEVEAQAFVAGEAANIDRLIARVQAEAARQDSRMLQTIDMLGQVAANWTRVMGPMQLLQRANGIDHAASRAVALRMRGLALWLVNERRMAEAMQRIYAILRREFGLLIELSARLEEDLAPAQTQPAAG
ncbi:hypothetical protein SSBR45G_28360 [Bradyrhizobium sp. SSBR45G]|uniref:hypothetical protein n=1 Tax=unclassified Bradyrhizobium TaxID=2631580 RepID=UPI002342A735|nr:MULTISPECIES: hypothetical protein [unclassified Bradyrhizobium]GLH77928.1 hypothetical protein SSBR45G_28360 [Bradyrhizobium sp. SSBR45G]GLH85451.1 hypothetical protein SSBR45R_29110 [Bradyrhizobium sp. SSBR45R]